MCEFKKTKENPPIALKNAVLKNSAYTAWDEAKKNGSLINTIIIQLKEYVAHVVSEK